MPAHISKFITQLEEADIMVVSGQAPYENFEPVVSFSYIYVMPTGHNGKNLSRDCYLEFDFDELEASLEYGGGGEWFGTIFDHITLSKTVAFE